MKPTTISAFCVCLSLVVSAASAERELPVFNASRLQNVRERWRPEFGSSPVRVEFLEKNMPCLAFPASFRKAHDRVCWDWYGRLTLPRASRITFQLFTSNRRVTSTIGVYFGTPNGWYARMVGPGRSGTWKRIVLSPADFSVEGKPDGWDKVNRFRFSVWSSGAGKAVYRLRDLRVVPADPAENILKNGSFEITGGGMPYAWGSGHWGVGHLPWATDMALWRRHWRLDRSSARHGKTSLCIINSPKLPFLSVRSVWFTPPKKPETWTVSAWLKADRAELPVVLECGGRSIETFVGRRWTQASLRVQRNQRLSITIAPKATGTLWLDAVQVQSREKPTTEFHAAFTDEATEAREMGVDWSPPRRSAHITAGRRNDGPTSRGVVRIDDRGRFLINGKPYLQHSLGLEFVSDPAILDFVARSGFRDVCIQIHPGMTTPALKKIFDRCTAVGLRIIPWLDGRIPIERFREHITALRNHPALLCWYVYDEPSGAKYKKAEERLRAAHELDPGHPAFINYLGNHLEGQAGDLYSTDVYPIPHSQPLSAIHAVERMVAAAAKEHKPVWMWLQGTGYAYWMDREPTPRELSCMVYGSLIAGARGIYYFAQIPRTEACFAEMRALCVELDALTPWVYSIENVAGVRCDCDAVLCRGWRRDNRVLVLAVNTGETPVQGATFAITGARGLAKVLFEDRDVSVRASRWQDQFGPYERHAYQFTGL